MHTLYGNDHVYVNYFCSNFLSFSPPPKKKCHPSRYFQIGPSRCLRWKISKENEISTFYMKLNYHDQKIRRTLTHDIQKHWTAISTLIGVISSVYRDLHRWKSNQRPQIAECLLDGNSIPNIIPLPKKENVDLYPCPWGHNNYVDAYF